MQRNLCSMVKVFNLVCVCVCVCVPGPTLNIASKRGLERVFNFSIFHFLCFCCFFLRVLSVCVCVFFVCVCVEQLWYPLSKTLAEKAAWDFAKENDLDVVVVNPGTVMGPVIPPRLNASMVMLVRLLQGEWIRNCFFAYFAVEVSLI